MSQSATNRRRCSACKSLLPLETFPLVKRRDRPPRRDAWCPSCRNSWHRERRQQRYRLDPEYRARVDADNRKRAKETQRERRTDRAFRGDWAVRFITGLQAQGWSLRRISEAAGLGQDTLANMLRNGRQPRSATFERLWDLALTLNWEREDETARRATEGRR